MVTSYNINHGCEEYIVTHISELTTVAKESDDGSVGRRKNKCVLEDRKNKKI